MPLSHAKEAQGLTDYVILIGIMTLALIGGQTYLKRGIQNSIKSTADDLSSYASTVYNLESQTLGAWESGLVRYTPNRPQTVLMQKNMVVNETPAANPIRTINVNLDRTVVDGAWTVLYSEGRAMGYSSQEKQKSGATSGESKE